MLRLFMLLVGLIYLMNLAQAGEVVVVHSNQAAFSKCQVLDSQMALDLPPHAEITVVFASGGTQTITGPFQGQLTDPLSHLESDSTFISNFVEVLNKIAQPIGCAPGIRNSQEVSTPDDIWVVDVSKTKHRYYCIAPASNRVVLWRPKDQSYSAATLLIKHRTTDKQVEVVWPAYKTTLKWPEKLPIVYGDTYNVELKTHQDGSTFKRLVLYQLPESLPTNSHKIVWMVGRGCISQAQMLLASLR